MGDDPVGERFLDLQAGSFKRVPEGAGTGNSAKGKYPFSPQGGRIQWIDLAEDMQVPRLHPRAPDISGGPVPRSD